MALQLSTGSDAAPKPLGGIISIDVEKMIHGGRQPVGKFIPKNTGVRLVTSDAVKYLKTDNKFYELIFEDTAHTIEMTKRIYDLAVDRLVDGGIIISHDACHPKFRGAVVAGIRCAGITPEVYLVEGDSCGLAIWQKPKKETTITWNKSVEEGNSGLTEDERDALYMPAFENIIQPIPDETEAIPEVPKKATKRKRRKKASKTIAIEEV